MLKPLGGINQLLVTFFKQITGSTVRERGKRKLRANKQMEEGTTMSKTDNNNNNKNNTNNDNDNNTLNSTKQ